jgi:hypothetical protein
MEAVCKECGGPAVDGLSCFEQMAQVLGWEGQDPELAAMHFLTVASYNLQHPAQFTDSALAGLTALYVEAVDGGWTNAQTRRRAVEMGTGQGKVLRPEAERRPVLKAWSKTIADVYLPDQPEGAPARVRAWVAAIRPSL